MSEEEMSYVVSVLDVDIRLNSNNFVVSVNMGDDEFIMETTLLSHVVRNVINYFKDKNFKIDEKVKDVDKIKNNLQILNKTIYMSLDYNYGEAVFINTLEYDDVNGKITLLISSPVLKSITGKHISYVSIDTNKSLEYLVDEIYYQFKKKPVALSQDFSVDNIYKKIKTFEELLESVI